MVGMTKAPEQRVLGLRFANGTVHALIEAALSGGLVVVPSAPVLVALELDHSLRVALLDADLVIPDSGLMVLLCRTILRQRITRVSGLEYLAALVKTRDLAQPNALFWVMPNERAMERLLAWAHGNDLTLTAKDCVVAPHYGKGLVHDANLLRAVENARPKHVILCLGGGVQERLGFFLKHNLSFLPGIHCIGAAIGFLTGDQVAIPSWADYFYLGWLFRCFSQPSRFVPRYWRALRLIVMILRYGEKLPPLRVSDS
jgi:N-acetylglucosaminyldiphosphoundecaprenol N-acetyl-beta-D-mannosaminyltransferase